MPVSSGSGCSALGQSSKRPPPGASPWKYHFAHHLIERGARTPRPIVGIIAATIHDACLIMSRLAGICCGAERVKNRPINVHQTLKYGTEKLSKALLGIAVVLFVCGVVGELFPRTIAIPAGPWPSSAAAGPCGSSGGCTIQASRFWCSRPRHNDIRRRRQGGARSLGRRARRRHRGCLRGASDRDPGATRLPDVTVFEVSRRFYEKYTTSIPPSCAAPVGKTHSS